MVVVSTTAFIDSSGRQCNVCGSTCVDGQRWRDQESGVLKHVCTRCWNRKTFTVHDLVVSPGLVIKHENMTSSKFWDLVHAKADFA